MSGRVLDRDTDDDYLALRCRKTGRTLLVQVRQAYTEILSRIADACFKLCLLLKNQTNRLAQYIAKKYGDACDHRAPFAKYPAFSSYRHRIITNGVH